MSRFHRRAFLRTSGLALAATAAGRVLAAPPPETPRMRTRPIPSTQEPLPVIGMGTWQTFDVGPGAAERAPLEEVLRAFVQQGGTLVDSSPMYGRSEEVVGALAEKAGLQPKLFLATKVWTSGKAEGLRQMEDSMRKLRARRLDLMEVHNLVDADTHLDTLRAWKEEGRVRYVGVTHYTASAHGAVVKLLQSRPVDFVQINYSVGEREAEQRLLSVARERGVAVIANRPFAGGGLLQRLQRKPLPPWAAAELDCDSWAQLLLKFVISHPAVTCAIPATSQPRHLRDNMKAGLGRLPDETLRARIAAEAA
jgi:diketogulonate reductase-like aldo/keto reductase